MQDLLAQLDHPFLLGELDLTTSHDGSSQLEAIPFLIIRKPNDIKGLVSVLQLLIVVNKCHSCLVLRDIGVIIDVINQANIWTSCMVRQVGAIGRRCGKTSQLLASV